MNDHDHTPGAGSPGEPDLAPAPGRAAPAAPARGARPHDLDGRSGPLDLDQLAGLVYDRIGEKIGHPPDARGEMPSVEEAVALREKAPELYDLWLKIAQDRAATGNYVQRAPYEVPERLAQSGRPRALSALVVVLAFCGYLAWLGGPGPYIAGLIAVFDLVAMLALFFGLRPDHLSDSRHSTRKRLTAGAKAGRWQNCPSRLLICAASCAGRSRSPEAAGTRSAWRQRWHTSAAVPRALSRWRPVPAGVPREH